MKEEGKRRMKRQESSEATHMDMERTFKFLPFKVKDILKEKNQRNFSYMIF
jgi:hypothetical protein